MVCDKKEFMKKLYLQNIKLIFGEERTVNGLSYRSLEALELAKSQYNVFENGWDKPINNEPIDNNKMW